jgi:hypothetical protein
MLFPFTHLDTTTHRAAFFRICLSYTRSHLLVSEKDWLEYFHDHLGEMMGRKVEAMVHAADKPGSDPVPLDCHD